MKCDFFVKKHCFLTKIKGWDMPFLPQSIHFWVNVIMFNENMFQTTFNGKITVYRPANSRLKEKYT